MILAIFFNCAICWAGFTPDGSAPHSKWPDAEQLMEQVYLKFHINYEMSRLHKIGYYQESMSDSAKLYYLADGIVEIFIPCNLNLSENASITPIKTRRKAFEEIESEMLLYGNASDMARSSIWRPHSFLAEKNRDDYTYEMLYDSLIGEVQVHVVAFSPEKNHAFASGKIYIDQKSLAIIRIDYEPAVEKSKVWERVKWSEEYAYRKGAYELSKVSFVGYSLRDHYRYEAALVMTQMEAISSFPEAEYIHEGTTLFETAADDFTADFWEGYETLRNLARPSQSLVATGN